MNASALLNRSRTSAIRLPFRAFSLAILGVAALSLCACVTSTRERHYYAAADVDDGRPVLKFYRITIKARSVNINSTYNAGFYDADGLRALFGEPTTDGATDAASPGYFRLVTTESGPIAVEQPSLFAVMYGADAQALARQVEDFANSKETGDQMARLLGAAVAGDLYAEVEEVEAENVDLRARKAIARSRLEEIAQRLESGEAVDTPQVQALLREAAAVLATAAGSPVGLPQFPGASSPEGSLLLFDRLAQGALQP